MTQSKVLLFSVLLIILQKYLVISEKVSTFAPVFETERDLVERAVTKKMAG